MNISLVAISDKKVEKLVRDTLKFNKKATFKFALEKYEDSILIANNYWIFRISEVSFPLTLETIKQKLATIGYSDNEKVAIKKEADKEVMPYHMNKSLKEIINRNTVDFKESTLTRYIFNLAGCYLRIILNDSEVILFDEDYVEVLKDLSINRYKLYTAGVINPLVIYDTEFDRNEGLIMPVKLSRQADYDDIKSRFIVEEDEDNEAEV